MGAALGTRLLADYGFENCSLLRGLGAAMNSLKTKLPRGQADIVFDFFKSIIINFRKYEPSKSIKSNQVRTWEKKKNDNNFSIGFPYDLKRHQYELRSDLMVSDIDVRHDHHHHHDR